MLIFYRNAEILTTFDDNQRQQMNDGVDSIETFAKRAQAQETAIRIIKANKIITRWPIQNIGSKISMLSVSVLTYIPNIELLGKSNKRFLSSMRLRSMVDVDHSESGYNFIWIPTRGSFKASHTEGIACISIQSFRHLLPFGNLYKHARPLKSRSFSKCEKWRQQQKSL